MAQPLPFRKLPSVAAAIHESGLPGVALPRQSSSRAPARRRPQRLILPTVSILSALASCYWISFGDGQVFAFAPREEKIQVPIPAATDGNLRQSTVSSSVFSSVSSSSHSEFLRSGYRSGNKPRQSSSSVVRLALGSAVCSRVFLLLSSYLSRLPASELSFALLVLGALREALRSYSVSANDFSVREDLFLELAVARDWRHSLVPWLQTGAIAAAIGVAIVLGLRAVMRSMKEWEFAQEQKDLRDLGDEAKFLNSTPIRATSKEPSKKRRGSLMMQLAMDVADKLQVLRLAACLGYLLPLLNALDFGEISISLNPYPLGVSASEPIVELLQSTIGLKYLYKAYLRSGYWFLLVWFLFITFFVRNKSAPYFVRFHSSQAILISMLLGIPQQIFFAVLNPWEAGLMMQTFMYYSMVAIFAFVVLLVLWCCLNALLKRTMKLPLVSEAAEMWAGKG